jgi:putative methanogen marker protein 4
MKILEKYELIAQEKKPINIGIGLGDSEHHNREIIRTSLDFIRKFRSKIYFFGKENIINGFLHEFHENVDLKLHFIKSEKPGLSIFQFLMNNTIQSILRGSLSSSEFLNYFKMNLNVKEINRLALLETFYGQQFFFGPVGIDECNKLENKKTFLELAIKEVQSLKITPKISILSGGRIGDIGRDFRVDKTIREANNIIKFMKDKYPNLLISHDEILIEQAIKNKSNLIMAPDGISGNLIYRTLVHLGGGKAFGAIYMGNLKSPIIDTSRVGKNSEIYGALILAQALS